MAKKKIEKAVIDNQIETPEIPKEVKIKSYEILEDFASDRFYSKGEIIKSGDLIKPIINNLIKEKKLKVKK